VNLKKTTRDSGFEIRACVLCLASCVLSMLFALGCSTTDNTAQLNTTIDQLNRQNAQLAGQVEQYKTENQQLQEQVRILMALPENYRELNADNLEKVVIHHYTNFYDNDHDGKKESLNIYIQPIDSNGDKIKAGGKVDVQLWDLDKPTDQLLLYQWSVEPQELQKRWVEFLVLNYRLTFDISEKITDFNKPYTVKIKFTDYLTGKVFEDQRVIKP
jgi:outer membrane murein-binding lipoprotein Lpp